MLRQREVHSCTKCRDVFHRLLQLLSPAVFWGGGVRAEKILSDCPTHRYRLGRWMVTQRPGGVGVDLKELWYFRRAFYWNRNCNGWCMLSFVIENQVLHLDSWNRDTQTKFCEILIFNFGKSIILDCVDVSPRRQRCPSLLKERPVLMIHIFVWITREHESQYESTVQTQSFLDNRRVCYMAAKPVLVLWTRTMISEHRVGTTV